ncbi:MAG: hypothetical protein HOG79_04065, partial [Prolixibacteraceae bacterium]|nr:hypothetical protein [Prolixibacteraceae bacterium]
MSDLDKHITISKNVNTENDLDFSFIRKKGLEYIEKLSDNLWTDYNTHDPGITILEMLSYAISDLGLRINLPIENLLAPENNSAPNIDKQFFTATEILSSKPVNELDYRKLFIDIKDVKNCWLKPYEKTVYVDCKKDKLSYDRNTLETNTSNFNLQGLYSIVVDLEEDISDIRIKNVKKEIRTKYHANRNLCEDLINIKEVDIHPISVCAKVEVLPEVDEEKVHAKVLDAIDNYFSPSLTFYSLKQMQDKG